MVAVDLRVEIVEKEKYQTQKNGSDINSGACLPILSSTTLSQLFLARVNFLLSSSSMVW